jgi:hypothetical protein
VSENEYGAYRPSDVTEGVMSRVDLEVGDAAAVVVEV